MTGIELRDEAPEPGFGSGLRSPGDGMGTSCGSVVSDTVVQFTTTEVVGCRVMGIDGSPVDHRIPLDTSSEAHRVQREIYLRLGGAGRLAIAFQLTETTRHLAMAGIRRRHPAYTDEEVASAWARLMLGDELCRAVWPDRPLVDP